MLHAGSLLSSSENYAAEAVCSVWVQYASWYCSQLYVCYCRARQCVKELLEYRRPCETHRCPCKQTADPVFRERSRRGLRPRPNLTSRARIYQCGDGFRLRNRKCDGFFHLVMYNEASRNHISISKYTNIFEIIMVREFDVDLRALIDLVHPRAARHFHEYQKERNTNHRCLFLSPFSRRIPARSTHLFSI